MYFSQLVLCDRLDPAVTVNILNDYFRHMTAAIAHHHGHVTGPTSPMGAANAGPDPVWNSRRGGCQYHPPVNGGGARPAAGRAR